MGLFGKVVGVAIETVKLPVEVARDVVTLGGIIDDRDQTYTGEQLDRIKDEARRGDEEAEP